MKRRTAWQAALAFGVGAAHPWQALAAPAAAPRSARAASAVVGSALARLRAAGVLRIAVGTAVPWSFLDREKRWAGFDIDVCERLAGDLGVKAEYSATSWRSASDDVFEGTADIAASVRGTPRRALAVSFSDPYVRLETTLVANKAKGVGLSTLADWNQPTVTIAVRQGGQAERDAKRRLPQARLLSFGDDASAIDALLTDAAQALVAQTPTPLVLAAKLPERVVLPLAQPLAVRSESFALRRDDTDLLGYINTWLRYREESGWLGERRDTWFRSAAAWEGRT